MNWLRKIRLFARHESGNAAVEYAILLGLMVAVALLGIDVLSRSAESSFVQVGSALDGSTPHKTNSQLANAPNPRELRHATETAQTNQFITAMVWGAVSIFVLVGVIVMWYQSRKKLKKLSHSEHIDAVHREVRYKQPKLIAKRQQILNMLAENIDRLLRSTLQVRQLMTKNVLTVPPEMPVDEVRKLMSEKEIRHVMVVKPDHTLLGVVSDRDLRSKQGKTAAQIMSREVFTVGPEVEVSPSVTMMLEHGISCLPIVEDGVLRGIVTSTDLMMAVQCYMHLLRKFTDPNAAVAGNGGMSALDKTLHAVETPALGA